MPLVAVLIDYRFEVLYYLVDFAGVFWLDRHIDCLAGVNRFEGCCHAGKAKGGKMLGIGLADFCLPVANAFRVGFSGVAVAARSGGRRGRVGVCHIMWRQARFDSFANTVNCNWLLLISLSRLRSIGAFRLRIVR